MEQRKIRDRLRKARDRLRATGLRASFATRIERQRKGSVRVSGHLRVSGGDVPFVPTRETGGLLWAQAVEAEMRESIGLRKSKSMFLREGVVLDAPSDNVIRGILGQSPRAGVNQPTPTGRILRMDTVARPEYLADRSTAVHFDRLSELARKKGAERVRYVKLALVYDERYIRKYGKRRRGK